MAQHADLTPEAWARIDPDQQILAIAAEMNRARKRVLAGDLAGLRLSYERILNLTDLTVEVRAVPALRRELLLWRDLIAGCYLSAEPSIDDHDRAFRALIALPAGPVLALRYPVAVASGPRPLPGLHHTVPGGLLSRRTRVRISMRPLPASRRLWARSSWTGWSSGSRAERGDARTTRPGASATACGDVRGEAGR